MKALIAPIALAAAAFVHAPRAEAQVIFVDSPSTATPVFAGDSYHAAYVPPYSYYAALPFTARGYVGYGGDEFAYHGRAYGSPSDSWTWPYMSGSSYQRSMSHYYYPPLR